MKMSQINTVVAAIQAGRYYRTQGMKITDNDIIEIALEQTKNAITRKDIKELMIELEGDKDGD